MSPRPDPPKGPKGPKNPKTPEAREGEVRRLADQLTTVGLPDEVTRPVVEDMEHFARTGEGFSRVVRVPCTPIVLQCLLSNQAHIVSHIRITRR